MAKGKVIHFNSSRGYGFIRPEGERSGEFFHITNLADRGELPRVGDLVLFDRVIGDDGRSRCGNVIILETISYKSCTQTSKGDSNNEQ